jgi:hypothetical protein
MCLRHWRMVPTHVKRAVWQHYRQGQCDDMRVTREWLEAADAAIGYVAKREGRENIANEKKAMERYRV